MINIPHKTIAELTLQENTVAVYFISVEKWKKHYTAFWELLDQSEKIKAERFLFDRDRERCVIAHGVKRAVFSHLLAIEPSQLVFRHNENKKPYLENNALYFNLSHSGSWILLGISQTLKLGVDIEMMKPLENEEDIVKRFFSKAEYDAYLSLPPQERLLGFYLAWTRKEAIVKAIGKGISFGLNQFEVNLNPKEPAQLLAMYDENWHEKLSLEGEVFLPDYIYAAAWQDKPHTKFSKNIIIF